MKLLGQKLYEPGNLLAPVPVVCIKIALNPDDVAGVKRSRSAARHLIEFLPPAPRRSNAYLPAVPVFPREQMYAPEEMVAYLALALQRELGAEVDYARALSSSSDGTYLACFQYWDARMGLAAGRLAVRLVDAAWTLAATRAGSCANNPLPGLFADGMKALKADALGVLSRRIAWECERRDIPWSRMASHPNQKTIVLGHGCKIRRFRGSYTDDTSFIATMLATSKQGACEFFRLHGIPVPRQVPVNDVDQAVVAARRIGYPVVIKPNFADMGHGVSIDLYDERSVRNAFEAARSYGLPILVAEQVPGDDYRITLIHGCMVAASRDIAAHVIGDGHSTIDELISVLNRDPRRGRQDYCILTTIVVDDEIHKNLKDQNYTLNSVPPQGAMVRLRRWWRSDHTAEDVTDIVHPDNKVMFERAARLIGLDLAGIDFVTSDIRRPWTEVGGAILEINPTPGLNSHVRAGAPDILTMVVDTAFPPGDNGRIPTAAIVGPLRAVRLVAEILNVAGYKVGLGTDEGIEIDQIVIVRGNFGGPARVNMILGDPLTEVAILQFSTAGVIDAGLGLDKATVAAVFAGEKAKVEMAQGPNGFTGPKDCAGLIVKAACEVVVLNAEDPGCVSLARQTRAKRLCWIANSPNHPVLADHIASGDLAITSIEHAGGNSICLWDSGKPTVVAPIFGLGAEDSETMFAVGIAFGLGVSVPVITEALNPKR